MIKICAAVAAVLISGTTLGSASAQEARTLKLAGVVPPTHYMAVTADKFFMDKVKELTSGAVDFEYYPAQQLGKANVNDRGIGTLYFRAKGTPCFGGGEGHAGERPIRRSWSGLRSLIGRG